MCAVLYCHRMSTQLQLTNISVSIYISRNMQLPETICNTRNARVVLIVCNLMLSANFQKGSSDRHCAMCRALFANYPGRNQTYGSALYIGIGPRFIYSFRTKPFGWLHLYSYTRVEGTAVCSPYCTVSAVCCPVEGTAVCSPYCTVSAVCCPVEGTAVCSPYCTVSVVAVQLRAQRSVVLTAQCLLLLSSWGHSGL